MTSKQQLFSFIRRAAPFRSARAAPPSYSHGADTISYCTRRHDASCTALSLLVSPLLYSSLHSSPRHSSHLWFSLSTQRTSECAVQSSGLHAILSARGNCNRKFVVCHNQLAEPLRCARHTVSFISYEYHLASCRVISYNIIQRSSHRCHSTRLYCTVYSHILVMR